MQDVAGKVAVVTGGASGLGRAMALQFAEAGMNIMIGDVEDEPTAKTRAEIEALGVQCLAQHADVSDRAAVEELAERTFSELGGAHVICNNAGVAAGGPLETATNDDWAWTLGVNLAGVVHGCQAFVPRLIEQGQGGHIVNTASIAGMICMPGLGIYTTTKFAVVGLTETLRMDLEPHGIGVSVLCPGFVRTGIHESDRNRPGHLAETQLNEEFQGQIRELVEAGIDPAIVGRRVLEAVRDNDLYIFTHPEFREAVEERFQGILAAFDKAVVA